MRCKSFLMVVMFLTMHEVFWACDQFFRTGKKNLPVITRVYPSETGAYQFKKHFWFVTTNKNQVYSVCRDPDLQRCDQEEMNRIRLVISRIQETAAKEARNRNNNKINKDTV